MHRLLSRRAGYGHGAGPKAAAGRSVCKVHKLLTEEGACYQYCDKTRHTDCFLLQCEGCGTIFHMDCSHLGELYDHLLEGHGFAINPRRTMFYGLCRECREAEK